MERSIFESLIQQHESQLATMRLASHELHRSVNQFYGEGLPYGYHLDMVVNNIRKFGHLVLAQADDLLPLFFSGYYHDSIEDARLTYNDVMRAAQTLMSDEQAFIATEIVYALTNDKGRNRAERAGEKYYRGIRETPYAPFVKLCDRLANITFSCDTATGMNHRMRDIYKKEFPHFLEAINPHRTDDVRFLVPEQAIALCRFD